MKADREFLKAIHVKPPEDEATEEIERRLAEHEAILLAALERDRAESIAAARGILWALLISMLVWIALWLA